MKDSGLRMRDTVSSAFRVLILANSNVRKGAS
jgi:hypothetical protein